MEEILFTLLLRLLADRESVVDVHDSNFRDVSVRRAVRVPIVPKQNFTTSSLNIEKAFLC